MKYNFDISFEGLEEFEKNTKPELFEKTFRVTMNEIVNDSFNKAKTKIKKKWNINIKKDGKEWAFAHKRTGKTNKRNGRMRIIKANKSNKFITIDIMGSPLNLSLFEFTWNHEVESKKTFKSKRRVVKKRNKLSKVQRGRVRVKILKSQVTTLSSAFVTTMKSGHTGIFQRSSGSPLPILEKRTISPQSMFKQVDFEKILEKDIDDKKEKRFKHNLNRLARGYWDINNG